MTKSRYVLFLVLLNLLLVSSLIYFFSSGIFSLLNTYTNHGKSICMPDLNAMSLEEAKKKLDSLGLSYEIDDSFYDPTYKPNQVLNFSPLVGEFIKENREVYIQINGNGLVPLPEINYKKKSLAMSTISEADLYIKNFIYVPDEAKDKVLGVVFRGKIIKTDQLLPYQSKIDLIVGRGKEDEILVPDLMGMEYELASKILKKYDFTQGNIYYKGNLPSDNLRIYRQHPLPGKIYNKAESIIIDLWLSEAEDKEIESSIESERRANDLKEKMQRDLEETFKKNEGIIIE